MPKGLKTETVVEDESGDGTNVYNTDEKVLADNNNMIYKSLVKNKKQNDEDGWFYFVHYDGWNKKWDAWVAEKLLMKHTDENITKMNELNKKTKDALKAKKEKRKSVDVGAKVQDEKISKKRKMDQQRELEEFLEPQVRVPIPFLLKKTLVDDWEWVTRSNLLVPLPRKPTVQDILKTYLDGKLKKKTGPNANSTLNIHQEFADGLQDYFDRALGTILLYRHERAQYQQGFRDKQPKAQASSHYGAEHLLRLFVRLPTLLANTDLSDAELAVLQNKIADFLKFLVKNHEEFFCNAYVASNEISSKKGPAKSAVKAEADTSIDEAAPPAEAAGTSMEK